MGIYVGYWRVPPPVASSKQAAKIGDVNLSKNTFTNITNATSTVSNVTKVTYTNVTINGNPVH
jgi:hypothetical protein